MSPDPHAPSDDGERLDPRFESVLRECLDGVIDADTPLRSNTDLAALGFESITLVRIMVTVERSFGVSIPDDEIGFDLFATPGTLWSTIQRSQAVTHGR